VFKPVRAVKSLLSFFTIIPVGSCSLDDAAEYFYLSPIIVGLTTGILPGVLAIILSQYFRIPIPAVLSFTFYMFITGFHHVDGLMDFADALMVRGSMERRREVLYDKYTGSAAIASVVLNLVVALAILSILPAYSVFKAYIAASTFSMQAAVTASYLGPPMMQTGSGRLFIDRIRGRRGRIAAALLYSAIVALLLSIQGVSSLILSQTVSLLIVYKSRRAFGGLNGDVLGAIIELSRTASIIGFIL
jgi:adenosylcobinamide-GDP ribazoletransferase